MEIIYGNYICTSLTSFMNTNTQCAYWYEVTMPLFVQMHKHNLNNCPPPGKFPFTEYSDMVFGCHAGDPLIVHISTPEMQSSRIQGCADSRFKVCDLEIPEHSVFIPGAYTPNPAHHLLLREKSACGSMPWMQKVHHCC
jgi:hypothetical protein